MAQTGKIIRKSIFTFLQNYQYFTSTPTFLAFPYAATYLLAQSLVSTSPLFPLVHGRLDSLFLTANFPSSSQLFAALNLKLSQTILTFLFVSPFAFSFLLLARASVIIKILGDKKSAFFSWTPLFTPLLITQLCSSLIILAVNATCFFILALCFNFLDVLGISSSQGPAMFIMATGAVVYSVILANACIISNLALVSSGEEKHGGFISILKACALIRGRTETALSLDVAVNMSLAATEALFQYRVMSGFRGDRVSNSGLVIVEGVFIACLYAVFLVLDTVIGCTFWRWCVKGNHRLDLKEEMCFCRIEIR